MRPKIRCCGFLGRNVPYTGTFREFILNSGEFKVEFVPNLGDFGKIRGRNVLYSSTFRTSNFLKSKCVRVGHISFLENREPRFSKIEQSWRN